MTIDDLERTLSELKAEMYEAASTKAAALGLPVDIRTDLAHIVAEAIVNYTRGVRGAERTIRRQG